MKTLGVLGGVGPQTTSKVYLAVIDAIRKSKQDKYPSIIIYNLPFPFSIENEAIIQGINSEKMIPYLIDGANILEKAGASFGILPCNTLHTYLNEIRGAVKITFLSIIEETVLRLKSLKLKTVGILATQTSIDTKIYSNVLEKNGITILYPTKIEQKDINSIIVELITGEKKDLHSKKLEMICGSLQERGAESILLACTDLQLATSNINSPIPIIDTTEILIQASVRELTAK